MQIRLGIKERRDGKRDNFMQKFIYNIVYLMWKINENKYCWSFYRKHIFLGIKLGSQFSLLKHMKYFLKLKIPLKFFKILIIHNRKKKTWYIQNPYHLIRRKDKKRNDLKLSRSIISDIFVQIPFSKTNKLLNRYGFNSDKVQFSFI